MMKKFRVLSDLHLDVNDRWPQLKLKDNDIFTVICGDTSGDPAETIAWIKANCHNGVGCSGNHLPYNKREKTVQELREELAAAFPPESDFTYLDCETGVFSKEVDGILFIGTCMYSDMKISHPRWNPDSNVRLNKAVSMEHMNDYRWGIRELKTSGDSVYPTVVRLTPDDYVEWFDNAYHKIDALLNENEAKPQPLPVVLFTHYNLIPDFIEHNGYLEDAYSIRAYNWPSYASDKTEWLKSHPSIKCYCCGHIHDVHKDRRNFKINRDDGSSILVVNNARGYLSQCHDMWFNADLCVNTDTWEVEIPKESTKALKEKQARAKRLLVASCLYI